MKKYELLEREENGLCRIKALKDFDDVKKGDIGGYVESEDNLSQEGNAWVYDNARVFDNAEIYGNAKVYGDARIYDNARVYGNAEVSGGAWVYDNAEVYGSARVFDNAEIYGKARVYGNAEVSGSARVYSFARVHGNVKVCKFAKVSNYADVYGDVEVNNKKIIGAVCGQYDNILFIQCSNRLITLYSFEGEVYCNIGCQMGMTLEQLEQRIEDDGGMKPHRQEYVNIMKCGRVLLGLE